jgi:hypothetical protein
MRPGRKIALALFALTSSIAGASVPGAFSVQGVLRDKTGALQSMPVMVSASLFDAQTGGNKLAGPYGPTSVMATNGLFTFPIADASLQTELAGAAQVWLELTVGSDTFARQLVNPQLFAVMCGTADVAMSLPGVTVASGNVGLGTSSPTTRLAVQGDGQAVSVSQSTFNYGTANPVGAQLAAWPGSYTNAAGLAFHRWTGGGTNFDVGYVGQEANAAGDYGLSFKTNLVASFGNASTTRMFIQTDGNIGIGTASPSAKLEILDNSFAQMQLGGGGTINTADSNLIRFTTTPDAVGYLHAKILAARDTAVQYNSYLAFFTESKATGNATDTSVERMRIDSSGNVGIGTTTPMYTLDLVSGSMRGNVVAPSDARLKTNVRTIDGALDAVERLRGVRFEWKKDGKQSLGVIAQEVEQVYPELVSTAPDGMKAVDYGKLAGVLIESTKALRAENAALRARLDRIEARLDRRAAR